jgi:dihydrofolate reductase
LAKVIVGMTISLDGFVADQNGNAGRLYPDLAALRHTAYMQDASEQTGAVLMGRRTFENMIATQRESINFRKQKGERR